jgi:hypothetical protein
MASDTTISRRKFVRDSSAAIARAVSSRLWFPALTSVALSQPPLSEFEYGDVALSSELHERQLQNSLDVLMNLSEDSILKPLRLMSGQPAPGVELGGWYLYKPDFDYRSENWEGFAPACTFGQWVSALARGYAINRSPLSYPFAAPHGIAMWDGLEGGADPQRDGYVAGVP